jgi:hypothetical protein
VRQLDREIKRLGTLIKERDELKRLLAAATAKPQAAVRSISRPAS